VLLFLEQLEKQLPKVRKGLNQGNDLRGDKTWTNPSKSKEELGGNEPKKGI